MTEERFKQFGLGMKLAEEFFPDTYPLVKEMKELFEYTLELREENKKLKSVN